MPTIAILAGAVRGHGRSKALLSTADALARYGTVRLYADTDSWPPARLQRWHGFAPAIGQYRLDWSDGDTLADVEPDADFALAWAKPLAARLHGADCPAVAWVESGQAPAGVDAAWCPSQGVADRLDGDDPPVRVVRPTWYMRYFPEPRESEASGHGRSPSRDIDVLVHGRKARDAIDRLPDGLRVETTGDLPFAELVDRFERSRVFLHPHADRFEPLGLMPIEAAHFGCRVAVPTNSGVAELLPRRAYDRPTEHVAGWFESTAPLP